MTDIEVKKTYKVDIKNEAERDLEDAGDKIKAAGKVVENKVRDVSRDLKAEYEKEKIKEKLD